MRRFVRFFLAVAAAITVFATPSRAATISLVGDVDCFGLGGPCPDGTLWRDQLGGVFFTSNQGAGDPLFTDIWTAAAVSYSHTYANAPASSATLELRIAGIHDINLATVYNVFFNGAIIGVIPPNLGANGFQEVLTYLFTVPVGLLTGNDLITATGFVGTDAFSVDYSRLTVETTNVPEPISLLLFGGALAAAALHRRRPFR